MDPLLDLGGGEGHSKSTQKKVARLSLTAKLGYAWLTSPVRTSRLRKLSTRALGERCCPANETGSNSISPVPYQNILKIQYLGTCSTKLLPSSQRFHHRENPDVSNMDIIVTAIISRLNQRPLDRTQFFFLISSTMFDRNIYTHTET